VVHPNTVLAFGQMMVAVAALRPLRRAKSRRPSPTRVSRAHPYIALAKAALPPRQPANKLWRQDDIRKPAGLLHHFSRRCPKHPISLPRWRSSTRFLVPLKCTIPMICYYPSYEASWLYTNIRNTGAKTTQLRKMTKYSRAENSLERGVHAFDILTERSSRNELSVMQNRRGSMPSFSCSSSSSFSNEAFLFSRPGTTNHVLCDQFQRNPT